MGLSAAERVAVSRNLALCAALALYASAVASAQQTQPTKAAPEALDPHAVQPERPTVATHAGTVATGWFEIETGAERDQVRASMTALSTPTVLKIGIASHAQLSIFGSTNRGPGESVGLGDAGVGVKWRLLDDAPVVGDFAVLPAVKLPTGSGDRGTGTTDASLLLISSHDLGPVAMDLNVGITKRTGNGTDAPKTAGLWTASFGGPFSGPLGWVAECFGYPRTTGPSGSASIVALLGGPTYLVRKWLAVDAGAIIPVHGPQPHALYAGAVYNVGRLWHAPAPRP